MLILGAIIILIITLILLVIGAVTGVALGFSYIVPIMGILFLGIGVFAWVKLGYKKFRTYLYNKIHYPNGTYKV